MNIVPPIPEGQVEALCVQIAAALVPKHAADEVLATPVPASWLRKAAASCTQSKDSLPGGDDE